MDKPSIPDDMQQIDAAFARLVNDLELELPEFEDRRRWQLWLSAAAGCLLVVAGLALPVDEATTLGAAEMQTTTTVTVIEAWPASVPVLVPPLPPLETPPAFELEPTPQPVVPPPAVTATEAGTDEIGPFGPTSTPPAPERTPITVTEPAPQPRPEPAPADPPQLTLQPATEAQPQLSPSRLATQIRSGGNVRLPAEARFGYVLQDVPDWCFLVCALFERTVIGPVTISLDVEARLSQVTAEDVLINDQRVTILVPRPVVDTGQTSRAVAADETVWLFLDADGHMVGTVDSPTGPKLAPYETAIELTPNQATVHAVESYCQDDAVQSAFSRQVLAEVASRLSLPEQYELAVRYEAQPPASGGFRLSC